MIKVAFDTSPLKSGHKNRGVGFYTSNLIDQFKKIEDIQIIEFEDISTVKNADLVHYPYFDFFQKSLPFNKKIPTLVTIHDVIPLIFPSHYPKGLKGNINLFGQKLSLQNVSAVITDSESSKEDISKTLNFSYNKIYPIYLAASVMFHQIKDNKELSGTQRKFNLPDEFILYTGNVNWNKNIVNMVEGSLGSGVDLVIVGKSFTQKENLAHPEMQSFAEYLKRFEGNPKIHVLGFVENSDLVNIMNLAAIGLLPSSYEGFGLPILEYQSCGLPVITSDVSSMPEVAGTGAVLINPRDPSEIAQAVKKILSDRAFRNDLISKGFDNIEKFSWEKCAKETVDVYKKVVNQA